VDYIAQNENKVSANSSSSLLGRTVVVTAEIPNLLREGSIPSRPAWYLARSGERRQGARGRPCPPTLLGLVLKAGAVVRIDVQRGAIPRGSTTGLCDGSRSSSAGKKSGFNPQHVHHGGAARWASAGFASREMRVRAPSPPLRRVAWFGTHPSVRGMGGSDSLTRLCAGTLGESGGLVATARRVRSPQPARRVSSAGDPEVGRQPSKLNERFRVPPSALPLRGECGRPDGDGEGVPLLRCGFDPRRPLHVEVAKR
jgi:hypothetical protein